jgi:SAM-dependent methyltransferase
VTRLYEDDAELYDIAFDWDISAEADWLVERLQATTVLEPGCGGGRMLEALADRGCQVVGFDRSPRMVEISRRRLGARGEVFEADMTHFDLGRTFDGAVCPINTLLHLSPAELGRHLHWTARHLERRARYLVQVGLVVADQEPFAGSHWEASRGETSVKVDWVDEELDVVQGVSRQRSRIEVLAGPRAGEIVEEVHVMTAWTPATWTGAIEASPFELVATYDGGTSGEWPRVDATATGGLLWHELAL